MLKQTEELNTERAHKGMNTPPLNAWLTSTAVMIQIQVPQFPLRVKVKILLLTWTELVEPQEGFESDY